MHQMVGFVGSVGDITSVRRSFRGGVSVAKDVVDAFMAHLPNLIERYEKKDIYNMDESGLFWKAANVNPVDSRLG